jgi:hypothetical protein
MNRRGVGCSAGCWDLRLLGPLTRGSLHKFLGKCIYDGRDRKPRGLTIVQAGDPVFRAKSESVSVIWALAQQHLLLQGNGALILYQPRLEALQRRVQGTGKLWVAHTGEIVFEVP